MYILGIDPGTIKCGYGIVKIENKKMSLVEAGFMDFDLDGIWNKMIKMDKELEELFNLFSIDEVAIESIFYAYNPKSFIKLAQFRGAICMKVLQRFGSFSEYTPLQVKQSVTGNGKSSKEQVSYMVAKMFSIKQAIKPFDVSDAIAVAVTHSQRI